MQAAMSSSHREVDSIYMFSSVRRRTFPHTPEARVYRVPVYMLCLITKGEAVLLLDGEVRRIRPLELYVLVPGMMIETTAQCGPIQVAAVLFKPVVIIKKRGELVVQDAPGLHGNLAAGLVPLRHPQQVLDRIVQLEKNSRHLGRAGAFTLRLQLETLIYGLTDEGTEPADRGDSRIARSIAYMESHYDGKISVDVLARIAEMTSAAYSRLFRKATGLLPLDYVNQLRIDKAKHLLRQEDSRVKEVSASVGFRSEFYFSRLFQRKVGVAPTLYMKRDKLRVGVASSLGYRDYLLSVGIEPVYSADLYLYPGMDPNEYQALFDHQLRKMSESRPDLIIGDHYHTAFQDQLRAVAPHVFVDFQIWDWRTNFIKIAELVDRRREAEQALALLELRITDVRQQLKTMLGSGRVTVMQVSHRAVSIQGRVHHPLNELLYGELEAAPGGQVPEDTWRWEMPPESLPVLETEHLFIQKHHIRAGSEEVFERMRRTAAWNAIPAVSRNQVRLIPNWFVMSWTPRGRNQIMDFLISPE
ncbi:AraC family transcriptional regulator [Paenibacillus puerhi]|uniref:AraC family transcriptional regulator n=1 Tax=Paenibacillus puerhi TaxID=2692622 RepID=UPI00135AA982|nr:AraC family transcriptional regulator [Paenibacillus puerhi]